MDDRPDFIVRHALASAVRTARHVSAAITLGALSLGLGAGSVAHAGVPLPVVAETTGMLTLATVVKRIAPSVVTIEGRGRVTAEPGTKRRQGGKGIALAARDEIHIFGSGVVFDARRGLIITTSRSHRTTGWGRHFISADERLSARTHTWISIPTLAPQNERPLI